MNTDDKDDNDKLWELLGKSRRPTVSPFFSRNILRAVRQETQEASPQRLKSLLALGRSLRRWTWQIAIASTCTVAALITVAPSTFVRHHHDPLRPADWYSASSAIPTTRSSNTSTNSWRTKKVRYGSTTPSINDPHHQGRRPLAAGGFHFLSPGARPLLAVAFPRRLCGGHSGAHRAHAQASHFGFRYAGSGFAVTRPGLTIRQALKV